MGADQLIWHGNPSLQDIEWMKEKTLSKSLGIEVTEIGKDFIKGKMPVNEKTKQPFGICHGGAFVALAEELGSIASWLAVNREFFVGVGVEINANHIQHVKSGIVTGICRPYNIKGKTHVWEIKIFNEQDELCCVSRFTCSIIAKKLLG